MAPNRLVMQIRLSSEVAALVTAAADALVSAGLSASADELSQRLVAHDGWLRRREADSGRSALALELSPFAELALRDAVGIAQSTSSREARAARISAMLTLAGF